MFLESIGADALVCANFSAYAEQGFTLARVGIAQREHYLLLTDAGPVHAEPAGKLYLADTMPVTGDWVAARVVGDTGIVEAMLPRRTCLSRRAAGKREEAQALAANVDLVFLVSGLDGDFNLRRLERFLTLVAGSGAEAVIVLNKVDLAADAALRISETMAVAQQTRVLAVSAREGVGLDKLEAMLGFGKTVALLGSSGAGKSTIANRLLGEEHFRTRDVRAADSRGRHTTVRRELLPLPRGGALIDTPGLRELQLWSGVEGVEAVFDEIAAAAAECRFRDCTHEGEPGCAVREAVERGAIARERWASFQKLRAEAEWHESQVDPLAGAERKRKWKVIHKAMRELEKG